MRLTSIRRKVSVPKILFIVSFLFAVFISAAMLEAQPSAGLSLKPTAGKAAAALTIMGSHFAPGEEIDIILQVGDVFHGLGTAKADVVVADAKGNFSVATGIPYETPPGHYKIEAVGNKGSTAFASIEVLK